MQTLIGVPRIMIHAYRYTLQVAPNFPGCHWQVQIMSSPPVQAMSLLALATITALAGTLRLKRAAVQRA